MECLVYIIQNPRGKIYIGQTHDVRKRLVDHNESSTGYTSKYRPWKLIYSEKLASRRMAMAREKYLKTGVGRDWIKREVLGG